MKKTCAVCCVLLTFFGMSLTGCQDSDKSAGRQIGEAGREVSDKVKDVWNKTGESTSEFVDDVKEGYDEGHQDEKK